MFDDFKEILLTCFKFHGKLDKTKFWHYQGIILIIQIIIFIILKIINFLPEEVTNETWFFIILILFYIFLVLLYYGLTLISLGPQARRLNDAGYSPFFLLFHLYDYTALVVYILCYQKSKDK